MSSKTGDLLLELEAADETVRDAWVSLPGLDQNSVLVIIRLYYRLLQETGCSHVFTVWHTEGSGAFRDCFLAK